MASLARPVTSCVIAHMPNAPEHKPPAHPVAAEIDQSLSALATAMKHVEDEDSVKAALAIGQAMGRLQALTERLLTRQAKSD
jgi:hypothetical protein